MAYAGDLKSPVLHRTCGFDPHPGHTYFTIFLYEKFNLRRIVSIPAILCDLAIIAVSAPTDLGAETATVSTWPRIVRSPAMLFGPTLAK